MSTLPTRQSPETPSTETVEQRFRRLEASWLDEIGDSSSARELCSHWAYREIINLVEAIVPFLLRDLQERPRLWVWALAEITGADPVQETNSGNINTMSEAWLRWGKEHGY